MGHFINARSNPVMPAQAGIQAILGRHWDSDDFASGGYASIVWTPAFAGVTA
jgi:hypothetical protein